MQATLNPFRKRREEGTMGGQVFFIGAWSWRLGIPAMLGVWGAAYILGRGWPSIPRWNIFEQAWTMVTGGAMLMVGTAAVELLLLSGELLLPLWGTIMVPIVGTGIALGWGLWMGLKGGEERC